MSSSTADRSEVDAGIWCAIAGTAADIPPVNSYVYYFVHGHFQNCPSDCILQSSDGDVDLRQRPVIPCKVISVGFYSSKTSFDQLFAVIRLQPVNVGDINIDGGVGNREDDDDIASFAKILTSTDVTGGPFAVPKQCADTIFPPVGLNYSYLPLRIMDTLSNAWNFRYSYLPLRNRHTFNAVDWRNFVMAKGLVIGDSVVFMKRKSTNDQLFIGIRKAAKETGSDHGGRINDVLAAVRAAAKPDEFEVVYYPTRFHVSQPNFVVRVEKVHGAIAMPWGVEKRVKMAIETTSGLPSVTNWYNGTIEEILWPGKLPSPWRMLQVKWDIPQEATANRKRVSPWQVQLIESSNPASRSPKGLKLSGHDVPAETESENQTHNFMQAFTELLKRTTPVMLSGKDISDPVGKGKGKAEGETQTTPSMILFGQKVEVLDDPVGKGKGKAEGETQTTPSMILFGQKIQVVDDPVGKGKGKAHEETNVDDHNNPPQP